MRLNSIRTRCKPFSLHQPIWTCHIKLLIKLIIKPIHPNTPNNISTKKKRKKNIFHVFPKIALPPQLLHLQPQSSPNLCLLLHYLAR